MSGGKEAFCPVLWRANGGTTTSKGLPVFDDRSRGVRGTCSDPVDCYQCPVLQDELRQVKPEEQLWVCPDCIGSVIDKARHHKAWILLPGFFTEGYCQYSECERALRAEPGQDPLECRYSILLQLVIGQLPK